MSARAIMLLASLFVSAGAARADSACDGVSNIAACPQVCVLDASSPGVTKNAGNLDQLASRYSNENTVLLYRQGNETTRVEVCRGSRNSDSVFDNQTHVFDAPVNLTTPQTASGANAPADRRNSELGDLVSEARASRSPFVPNDHHSIYQESMKMGVVVEPSHRAAALAAGSTIQMSQSQSVSITLLGVGAPKVTLTRSQNPAHLPDAPRPEVTPKRAAASAPKDFSVERPDAAHAADCHYVRMASSRAITSYWENKKDGVTAQSRNTLRHGDLASDGMSEVAVSCSKDGKPQEQSLCFGTVECKLPIVRAAAVIAHVQGYLQVACRPAGGESCSMITAPECVSRNDVTPFMLDSAHRITHRVGTSDVKASPEARLAK